jgi:phosphoribosylformimino-5-aminoimidazole carboxamide ribotide isomerase
MTRFRPCIDLHAGVVKQIVGGTLDPSAASSLVTNHTSSHPAPHFAQLYRTHNLAGAHIIMLGPGNAEAAKAALVEWPGHMQVGGGINEGNAREWIEAGAEKVIVTSWLFEGGEFSRGRLEGVVKALDGIGGEGGREKLVVDLSCRRVGEKWVVAMDKWTRLTDLEVCQGMLRAFLSI